MERVGEREELGVYQFISNVMAEYSTDFNNLDEATTETTRCFFRFQSETFLDPDVFFDEVCLYSSRFCNVFKHLEQQLKPPSGKNIHL